MRKTKALISCTVTVQLICAFVFAFTKSRSSHDPAHFVIQKQEISFRMFVPKGYVAENSMLIQSLDLFKSVLPYTCPCPVQLRWDP